MKENLGIKTVVCFSSLNRVTLCAFLIKAAILLWLQLPRQPQLHCSSFQAKCRSLVFEDISEIVTKHQISLNICLFLQAKEHECIAPIPITENILQFNRIAFSLVLQIPLWIYLLYIDICSRYHFQDSWKNKCGVKNRTSSKQAVSLQKVWISCKWQFWFGCYNNHTKSTTSLLRTISNNTSVNLIWIDWVIPPAWTGSFTPTYL